MSEQKDQRGVMENRLKQKLARGMTNVVEATHRLKEEGKISKDLLVDVGSSRKAQEPSMIFRPDPITNFLPGADISYVNEQGILTKEGYIISNHAIRQTAEKLRIPATYLTSLIMGQEWQKTLAYEILNTHNSWVERDKVLVRAVGHEVRGVLSDQYRRLDSEMIFGTHIDEVFKNGGALSDGYMDESRVMVESLLPQPIEIQSEMNGTIWLGFGTRIDTSDYGLKALELRSFVIQLICMNGLVRESVLRSVHLGAKLPDNLALSAETYRLDSMTTASAVRDLTKNLYSTEMIKTRMLEVKASSEIKIDPAKELTQLFKSGKMLKGETEEIGKLLMRNDPENGLYGESTLWKLTQGITAYANAEGVDMTRRMDLQELAGDLFGRIKN